jgi:Asp-tRNA(Asn)/Glu-tRNA(Gln) amidotransferase A subunit family amidase
LRGELLGWLRGDRVLILPVATELPLHDHEPTDVGFEILTPCRAVALFGLPALSVPCPRAPDGRPVSVQVVGPPFREDLVLAVGSVLEEARAGGDHAGP